MVRTGVKVLLVDVALLIGEFFVIVDLQNRAGCVMGEALYGQTCIPRSNPSFSYSILTQFLSLVEGGRTLTSPPTLDWVQVLVVALLVVNVWYVGRMAMSRRVKSPTAVETE